MRALRSNYLYYGLLCGKMLRLLFLDRVLVENWMTITNIYQNYWCKDKRVVLKLKNK